jgi:hypothetical protein
MGEDFEGERSFRTGCLIWTMCLLFLAGLAKILGFF